MKIRFSLFLCMIAMTLFLSACGSPSPSQVLTTYCGAFAKGDYQTAYNLFSSSLQSQIGSESQFASSLASNKVTNCNGTNIRDAAGTGTLTLT